jgi:sugar lactone lactonase YvrE
LTARAGGTTSRLGSVMVRRPPLRLTWPTSVEARADGSLLVVENGRNRVLEIDPATGATRVLASGLAKPVSAVTAPSGSIYVSDGLSVRRVDAGAAPHTVATADEDIGPVAIGPDGSVLYVTSTRLFRLPAAGGAARTLVTGLTGPHGVAVATNGTLLVSDTGTDRVLRVDPSTGASSTLFQTRQPRGIDVAADGTIYVVEAGTKRVGRFSAAGARLGHVGPVFGDPYDVAAGPAGAVFVVDTAASGVIRRVGATGTVTIPTG